MLFIIVDTNVLIGGLKFVQNLRDIELKGVASFITDYLLFCLINIFSLFKDLSSCFCFHMQYIVPGVFEQNSLTNMLFPFPCSFHSTNYYIKCKLTKNIPLHKTYIP